jgi:hypothetical protein
MRLDIRLMHRLGGIAALNDHLGFLEAGLDVALVEVYALGDIRRLGRLRLDIRREQIIVQDRRIVCHRRLDVDDIGQHLVLHVDQFERLVADRLRPGDRGTVDLIQRLAAPAIARGRGSSWALADERLLRQDVRKILGANRARLAA